MIKVGQLRVSKSDSLVEVPAESIEPGAQLALKLFPLRPGDFPNPSILQQGKHTKQRCEHTYRYPYKPPSLPDLHELICANGTIDLALAYDTGSRIGRTWLREN